MKNLTNMNIFVLFLCTKQEKYVILVGCSMFELNQRRNKCFFGCLKYWMIFGDIEYNIYFWWCQGGERHDIFESIDELSYLAIIGKNMHIYWLLDNT